MTLNNLQIKIKDFKSIQDTDWISLDGKFEVIGRNFIDGGSNGSGKSSIIEALYTSVSLCDVNVKSDEQKQLKKYFRENKNPFEILVKFSVGNKDYQIKATPDGIKEGTAEGKKHLYTLITSFLMQGMTNSLIKQEASEVKSVISSYFECDYIIDNIIKNSNIVRGQLKDKLADLNKDKTDYDTTLSQYGVHLENYQRDLERLESAKIEIQNKVGFATFVPYDENKHTKILSEIEKLESIIKTTDSEIMKFYEEKSSLSNGVENKIKELKEEKNNKIETEESSYIRTIGNKFGSYVKKLKKGMCLALQPSPQHLEAVEPLLCPCRQHGHDPFVDRRALLVTQCPYDLPLNDMLAKRPFCPVIRWLHNLMNDKREPVLEAVLNLVNELFHLLSDVFSPNPSFKRCSRHVP